MTIDQDKNIICGDGATATKNPNSTEEGTGMIVIGNSAAATGLDSIALGTNTVAKGDRTTVIGGQAKADHGGVAIGYAADASGTYDAVAIGEHAKASGRDSTAIGKYAAAEGQDSLAIAYSAKALAKNSVALGYQAKAAVEESIAIGYRSSAESEGSFAFGSNSKVTGVNSVAIGTGSEAKRDNSVSVGAGSGFHGPEYRQIINVAYGTGKNDAATYGQILRDTWSTIKIDDNGNGSTKLTKNDGTEGPTINVDASSLNNKITKNTNSITAVDNKIGSLSTDGTYIKKANNVSANLVELDKQVNTNATAITNKTNLDLSNINAAGENVIKNLAGNKAGEIVDTKLGNITSENYVKKADTVNANISALDTQVKANADAIGSLSADGTYIKKANNVSANLGALDTQVKTNTDAIGSLSADGKYIKKANNVSANLVELDNQVNTNTTALTTKANLDLSNINADGETKIKNLAGSKAGEIVDTKLGNITSENYVKKADTVNANISALDTQVKANADDIIAANTKITAVDNKIGSLSADGNYIKKANNVSANLVELDNQVNANATAITNKANLDLSNISTAGKDVIINLAGNKAGEIVDVKLGNITSENYVKKANTVNANISALDTQLNKVDNKIGTMTDGNYVSAGNTVAGNLSALDNQLKANAEAINTKADKDLSNITDAGKNVIKDLAGNKAGEVVDAKLGDITSENYVKKADTVNANISALDKQVKTNADAINTKADKDLSNITDAGKNVIKDLAGNKAGEVVDAKLGDITSENYVKKADTVNANISALDKQMKANADNIGDTSKLTAAGLGSNLSDAVVNVNNKVGTADELKALKDAGLGDNLAQATAAVNKKADKNAADIKTVNGRVDELGGRVDTLGGAVSKLDTKVNKVGAGAAALAALHPMDFDPDNKLSFAAGVGSYHGASAVAIGAFYRPSEQVMFSISGNMGNGENMVNAGVSFALDRPSKTPTTKAALVKPVAAQNEQIAALKETVAEQKEIVAEQNEKIARLEAMVEKLAAKQST